MSRETRFPALVVALVGTLLVAAPGGPGWPTDNGVDTWPNPWNGPDIQVPYLVIGGTSLLRVRLRNNGPDPITGDLQLFYTEQGTAAKWWNDWETIKVIGNVTVPSGGRVMDVLWENVPAPGHFCLLARWDSPVQGPMTFHNNLAWKNVNLVRFRFDLWLWSKVRIRNPEPGPGLFHLVLARPDRTSVGRLVLDLGPTLTTRWQQVGQPGVGVRPAGGTQVEIRDPRRAVIQNLLLYPDDQLDVNLGLWVTAAAGGSGDQYPVSVIQTDTQGRNVGGLELTAVVE
ncbi:hypothetical protein [Actinophytocola sp.]|uniref:hypothetical protein n=1 Tax=Actinophytocola sp. TaxID=1872138 RepID=UPI002ED42EB8